MSVHSGKLDDVHDHTHDDAHDDLNGDLNEDLKSGVDGDLTSRTDKDDEKQIPMNAAISFINDWKYSLIRIPGDVKFILPRQQYHKAIEGKNTVSKELHSTVLIARSEWFRNSYANFRATGDLSSFEKTNEKLEIRAAKGSDKALTFNLFGVTSETFQTFITFLYAAQGKVTDDNVYELLELQGVFQVAGLQNLLKDFFVKKLEKVTDLKVVIKYLKLANENKMDNLKHECFKKMRENKLLTKNAAWKGLVEQEPELVVEFLNNNS